MSISLGRFADRTIVVTGGGSGIGFQIAKDLLEEGAFVHILGRNAEKLGRAKDALGKDNGIFTYQCDISKEVLVKQTSKT